MRTQPHNQFRNLQVYHQIVQRYIPLDFHQNNLQNNQYRSHPLSQLSNRVYGQQLHLVVSHLTALHCNRHINQLYNLQGNHRHSPVFNLLNNLQYNQFFSLLLSQILFPLYYLLFIQLPAHLTDLPCSHHINPRGSHPRNQHDSLIGNHHVHRQFSQLSSLNYGLQGNRFLSQVVNQLGNLCVDQHNNQVNSQHSNRRSNLNVYPLISRIHGRLLYPLNNQGDARLFNPLVSQEIFQLNIHFCFLRCSQQTTLRYIRLLNPASNLLKTLQHDPH